jgi:hypothetical protein
MPELFGVSWGMYAVVGAIIVLLILLLVLISQRRKKAALGRLAKGEASAKPSPKAIKAPPAPKRPPRTKAAHYAALQQAAGSTPPPPLAPDPYAAVPVLGSSPQPRGYGYEPAPAPIQAPAAPAPQVHALPVEHILPDSDPLQAVLFEILQGWGDLTQEDTNRLAVFRPDRVVAAVTSAEIPKELKTSDYARTRLTQLRRWASGLERDLERRGEPPRLSQHEYTGMSGAVAATAPVAATAAVAGGLAPPSVPGIPLSMPAPPVYPPQPQAAPAYPQPPAAPQQAPADPPRPQAPAYQPPTQPYPAQPPVFPQGPADGHQPPAFFQSTAPSPGPAPAYPASAPAAPQQASMYPPPSAYALEVEPTAESPTAESPTAETRPEAGWPPAQYGEPTPQPQPAPAAQPPAPQPAPRAPGRAPAWQAEMAEASKTTEEAIAAAAAAFWAKSDLELGAQLGTPAGMQAPAETPPAAAAPQAWPALDTLPIAQVPPAPQAPPTQAPPLIPDLPPLGQELPQLTPEAPSVQVPQPAAPLFERPQASAARGALASDDFLTDLGRRISTAEALLALPLGEQESMLPFLKPSELGKVLQMTKEAELKKAVIDTLESVGSPTALDIIYHCLDDPDPQIQSKALEAADRLLGTQ